MYVFVYIKINKNEYSNDQIIFIQYYEFLYIDGSIKLWVCVLWNSLNCKFVCFEIDSNCNKLSLKKKNNKFDHSNFNNKIYIIFK